jgi:ABC-2 type transport system ATP-binding protein
MVFLEFKNIKKKFRKNEVLRDVSFNVNQGEIFGLIGKSGGGKSTLFKIIIGMLRVDQGRIFLEGNNVLRKTSYLRKNTGFATQENMLFNELTVQENSEYFGELYGVSKEDIRIRFQELIRLLELQGFENLQVNQLSGGMQKRANILVSLIHRPKLLILDEPTIGLDSILRASLWEYIHKINKEGTTILVTSHLLDEIEKNCKRIGILKDGRMYAIATPSQYKNTYKTKNFNEVFKRLLGKDLENL